MNKLSDLGMYLVSGRFKERQEKSECSKRQSKLRASSFYCSSYVQEYICFLTRGFPLFIFLFYFDFPFGSLTALAYSWLGSRVFVMKSLLFWLD